MGPDPSRRVTAPVASAGKPQGPAAAPGDNSAYIGLTTKQLTEALYKLFMAGAKAKQKELDPAEQQAALGEQMGIGRNRSGAGFESPLTELTRREVIDGEEVIVPDRTYYDKQEIEDENGYVFYFLPIKKAKFLDAKQNLVEFNFAEPHQKQYLMEP